MNKIGLYIRSLFLNLVHFHSLRKRVLFGKQVKIIGNVSLSEHITLDDNVEVRNLTKEQMIIGPYTCINRNTVLRGKVTIGEHVSIAPNCMIIGTSHRFDDDSKLIQDQGFSIIGAGSIVTKSIPPMSVAFGNPCRVRRNR